MRRRRIALMVLVVAMLAAMATPVGAAQTPGEDQDESWIVVMTPGAPATVFAPWLVSSSGGSSVDAVFSRVLNGFSFSGSAAAAADLAASPWVTSVSRDGLLHTTELVPFGTERIGAWDAYLAGFSGKTDGGTPVRVAVLDSGVSPTHPDLAPNIVAAEGRNCINPGSAPNDDHGHGTHVAGTVAAIQDSGPGSVGVASGAAIVPVKVVDASGFGTDSQVICGLDHVAALAADGVPTVVNMSLGEARSEGTGCSSAPLHEAICNLNNLGVVVVAAAGNDGASASNFYPAAYPETIAVSAIADFNGQGGASSGCAFFPDILNACDEMLGWFSNNGPAIDVAAPGVNVYSTTLGGSWGFKSGTSMAAPHVAGVAALMLGANPGLSPAQVRSIMTETGECPDGATSGAATCSGHGQWQVAGIISGSSPDPDGIAEPLVDAYAATQMAAALSGPDETPPVLTLNGPNPQYLTVNETYTELGATAFDFIDGDVTSAIVIDSSAVNTAVLGTYPVTYDVTDSSENAADQVTRSVEVLPLDTTAPVITLLGADPQEITLFDEYVELGAVANDDRDGDITGAITINASAVNTGALGSYGVTYNVSDVAGNPAAEVTRTVDVVPPPDALYFTADNRIEVYVNGVSVGSSTNWKQANFVEMDLQDGDVVAAFATNDGLDAGFLAHIIWDGTTLVSDSSWKVATTAPAGWEQPGFDDSGWVAATSHGGYGSNPWSTGVGGFPNPSPAQWIWTTTNQSSGSIYFRFVVEVLMPDVTAPVITLTGLNPQYLGIDDAYMELGATALDDRDGDISAGIVIDASVVDTSAAGSYSVTYDVSDLSGNVAAQVVRTVVVEEDPPPPDTLTFSADNRFDAYVNGVLVASSTNWKVATHVETQLDEGDVVAVYAHDDGGVAGFIAEIVWDEVTYVSDNLWRASTSAPEGWEQPGFDDSAWGPASLYGQYGVAPWSTGVSGFPSGTSAQWIWSSNNDAHNDVFFRFVVEEPGPDETAPVITLSGANPQYVAVGDAYVELGATAVDDRDGDVSTNIDIDDSDVVTSTAGTYAVTYNVSDAAGNAADEVVRTVIVEATPPEPATIVFTGDNIVEVFVNGTSIGYSSNWKRSTTVEMTLTAGDVIAAKATDRGGVAAFLAQITIDGTIVESDSSWKVSTSAPAGWDQPTFDDSSWNAATSYGTYGVRPWRKKVSGFPSSSVAEWIWTSNNYGDNAVYFRYTVGS